jgi:colicin import membrane protein
MASGAAFASDDSMFRYGSRQHGLWRSAALAAAVHLALLSLLVVGVHIQSHAPEVVTVELWEPPPAPQPKPVVEAPKPPPPPPAPKPEPAPEIKKPDIAIQEKPKPKPAPPKPEPKPVPKPKPAPPKRDVQSEKRMREQLALEQKKIEKDLQAAEQARQERERRELIARQQAEAASRAVAGWTDKIRQKIRGNIIYDLSLVKPNAEAIYDVTLLPDGEVLSASMRKSSGNPGYDEAVYRAILKSSPLPKPDSPSAFRRQLELHFRPQDQ